MIEVTARSRVHDSTITLAYFGKINLEFKNNILWVKSIWEKGPMDIVKNDFFYLDDIISVKGKPDGVL